MALKIKKIGDTYCTAELYYRIEGIDFTANKSVIIFVRGYTTDEDKKILDNRNYTISKEKSEPVSYAEAYEYLKTLDDFSEAEDV